MIKKNQPLKAIAKDSSKQKVQLWLRVGVITLSLLAAQIILDLVHPAHAASASDVSGLVDSVNSQLPDDTVKVVNFSIDNKVLKYEIRVNQSGVDPTAFANQIHDKVVTQSCAMMSELPDVNSVSNNYTDKGGSSIFQLMVNRKDCK